MLRKSNIGKSITAKLAKDRSKTTPLDDDEDSNAYAAASVSSGASSEGSRAGLSAAIRHHASVLQESHLEGIDEDDLGGKPLKPKHTTNVEHNNNNNEDYYQDDSTTYTAAADHHDGIGARERDGESTMYSGGDGQSTMYSGGGSTVASSVLGASRNVDYEAAEGGNGDDDDDDYPPPKPLRGPGGSQRSLGSSQGSFATRSSRLMASEGDPSLAPANQYDLSGPDPRWNSINPEGKEKNSGILKSSRWNSGNSSVSDDGRSVGLKSVGGGSGKPKPGLRNMFQKQGKQGSSKTWASADDYTVQIEEDERTAISFASTTRFSTSAPVKSTTRARALLCLACLVVSVILSVCYGQGASGLWMTNHIIGTAPGTDAAKLDGTGTGGRIPGSLGPAPAYNESYDIPDLAAMNIFLPGDLEYYQDWTIPFPASNRSDIPVLWMIPRAGSNAVVRILGSCLGLVQVSGEGANNYEEQLQILETPQGTRFVNVDSTTVQGLERAKRLDLAESGMAEVMYTHLIPEAASVFSLKNRGRLFALFRHPVERAVSLYYQAQILDPQVADMSLADFASSRLPNNEMTRTLVNKLNGEDLTEDDVFLAMEVLRRKCVIGLSDHVSESMARFRKYFGWDSLMVGSIQQCEKEFLAPSTSRPVPPEQSDAYNYILMQNRFDVRLYEFARFMFDFQGGNTRNSKI